MLLPLTRLLFVIMSFMPLKILYYHCNGVSGKGRNNCLCLVIIFNKYLYLVQKILYDLASISPASFFTLLQPTSSLSSSHMHLLKRLPNKPCCFMPFSSVHAIFSMCYLSFKSLLREALLPHMSVLSGCLSCYCNYLFF